MAWFRRSDEQDNHYPTIDPDMDPNLADDPELRKRLQKRREWKQSLIQQTRFWNRGRTVEEKRARREAEENARPWWVRLFWTAAAWIVGGIFFLLWAILEMLSSCRDWSRLFHFW